MEFTNEVLNITKIKEGFFIGDCNAGTNFEVLIQFKITHIINAAGGQIPNQFEDYGKRYFTINWFENAQQNLFDPQDQIAESIVNFIDESYEKGEGVLSYSLRGQDRVCLVVLIYLMKKYNWSLKKSLELLQSRKQDIDIPNFFFNQLKNFENRLYSNNKRKKSNTWFENGTNEPEEDIIRNTYLNGLSLNEMKLINPMRSGLAKDRTRQRRRIGWADSNPYGRGGYLISVNQQKDLINQKNIKKVTSHLISRPSKSCMKYRISSSNPFNSNDQVGRSYQKEIKNNINFTSFDKEDEYNLILRNNSVNINESRNINMLNQKDIIPKGQNAYYNKNKMNLQEEKNIIPTNTNYRINNFFEKDNKIQRNIKENSNNNIPKRYPSEEKSKKYRNNYDDYINNEYNQRNSNNNNQLYRNIEMIQNEDDSNKKVIIANNFEQIINNNINNIFIQNSSELNPNKYFKPQDNINQSNSKESNIKYDSKNINYYPQSNMKSNPTSKKKPINKFLQQGNNYPLKSKGNFYPEEQENYYTEKQNQNQYMGYINQNKEQNQPGYLNRNKNYPPMGLLNNYQPKNLRQQYKENRNQMEIQTSKKPLNNFDLNLLKKPQTPNFLSRPSLPGKGPIKIQKDQLKIMRFNDMDIVNYKGVNTPMGKNASKSKKDYDNINRRPSTAPQKDKTNRIKNITSNNNNNVYKGLYGDNRQFSNTLKRAPSPMLPSYNRLNKYQKIHPERYRVPSPMLKSNYYNLNAPSKHNNY